jgi:hypothetical protein
VASLDRREGEMDDYLRPHVTGRICVACDCQIPDDHVCLTHDGPLCKPCAKKRGYTWEGMDEEVPDEPATELPR